MNVTSQSPTLAGDFGTVTKALVSAKPGRVLGFVVENANAAVRYFLLHNKATAPVATDVPLYSFRLSPGVTTEIGADFFQLAGGPFNTGIGWSISTTKGVFTDAATAAEHLVQIHWSTQSDSGI